LKLRVRKLVGVGLHLGPACAGRWAKPPRPTRLASAAAWSKRAHPAFS